jgi:hypothetical protein
MSTREARRWRVYCTQFAQCRWKGYRMGVTREDATARPCPICGKQVAA